MNEVVFKGKWRQFRGKARGWWGRLTDDDLDRAAGKLDVMVGVLQEKYGYTRQHATKEIRTRMKELQTGLKEKTSAMHGK